MKFFIYLIFLTNLFATDIDPAVFEDIIAQNPHAYKEKIILAKYYTKNDNDLKATMLIEDVLRDDAKNEDALRLKKYIQRKQEIKTVFRDAGLQQPITQIEAQKRLDSYYEAKKYQFYSNLYQALIDTKITLDDSYHIKVAYIYLWDGRYQPV